MKESQINIRISSKIKEQLKEKADKDGMSISDYVRFLILKNLGK